MQRLAGNPGSFSNALIWVLAASIAASAPAAAVEPQEVSFATPDGGEIHALLYGDGLHAVVLAHGRVFDKESWGRLPERLAEEGLAALAIDFRGYGQSRAGSDGEKLFLDIIAGMRYLKALGAERVSVLGASMGGGAAARAAVLVEPDTIDCLVLLAPVAIPKADEMKARRIVYISAEGDPSMDRTRSQYEQAPEPKSLTILPGDAHAQHLFKTEHSEALVEAIVAALTDES